MQTPWGKSDSKQTFARGLSFVSTPSHGGFAVAETFGRKNLSIAAQQRGAFRNGYFFFEEDCDASIILLELPITRNGLDEQKIIDSLSVWHADYLLQRGIEPTAEGLKIFNQHRLEERLRTDKSPNLIVSASGDWHPDCPEGSVLVTTADDHKWLVPAAEYDNRRGLNLLSLFSSKVAL
jgi:hypothetical protein